MSCWTITSEKRAYSRHGAPVPRWNRSSQWIHLLTDVVFSKSEHCKVPQLLSTLVSTPLAYITFSNHSLANPTRAIQKTVQILNPGLCYQHRLWFQEYLYKKWFFNTLFTHGGKKYRYSWEHLLLRFTGFRKCWSNISSNQQTRHQPGDSKKASVEAKLTFISK